MTATAPGFRRRTTFRWRRPSIDARVVTGVALVAVSVVGAVRLTPEGEPAHRVWVAAQDLDAGHVITADDVRPGEVRGDRSVVAGLAAASAGRPVGRLLRLPVTEGAAVPAAAMGGSVAAGRVVTVPVTAEHALGGDIRPGDRIDVLASFDKGTDAARTITVTRAATVEGVVRSDGLFGQSEGSLTGLTLLVDPDDATTLAFVARNADLDVVKAQGNLDGRGQARVDVDSLR